MAGMDKRNEYLAAVSCFNPRNKPVAMVAPDLDNPGITASPCDIPMIRESFIEKRELPFYGLFTKRVKNKITPVKISIEPAIKTDEKSRSAIL